MGIRPVPTSALALGFALLMSHGALRPVGAQELSRTGDLIGSSINQDAHSATPAEAPGASQPKGADSSSKPSAGLAFACDPRSHGVSQYEGGTVAYCTQKDLKTATTDSALIQIKPGAARAPHWHDTWEQQILISGKAKTYLIDEEGRIHNEVLTQGMVAVLPAGMTHWTETIGDQPAVLLLSFPAGFKTFELDDSLIQVERQDQRCTSGRSTSCGAKQKSLILKVKDGLI